MFSLILTAILSVSSQAPVKDIQNQLEAAFRSKVLTLRTFSKSNHQQFDENGQPKKQTETGSWTVYSQIRVNDIQLMGPLLRLSGVRIIHHYDRNLRKLIASPSTMNVDIDIDVKKEATSEDISAAVATLLVGPEGLLPLVPSYWRSYLGAKKDENPIANESHPQPVRVAGLVQSAKLLKQVLPKYSEVARGLQLQGAVALQVEINETGDVGNIAIILPAGAGLDESAIEAVSQWKYKPTTLNGNPVRVVTTVTVNYQSRQ